MERFYFQVSEIQNEDVNGERRIKYDVIICRKIFGTPARSSLENVRKDWKLQKSFTIILQKVANRKQFNWYLKLLIGQFGLNKPGLGMLLNER